MKKVIALALLTGILFSCKKKTEEETTPEETPTAPTAESPYPDTVWSVSGTGPHLILKFKFDSTQVRLNNFGMADPYLNNPDTAAQSPVFRQMASHYIELAQYDTTQLLHGKILYRAPETTAGGPNAIQFNKSVVVREGVPFFSIPLSQITPATYKWLRVSLSYQNYDIKYLANGYYASGTIASFLGFSTYVEKYKIKDKVMAPSASVGGPYASHPQGYWGFESYLPTANYYYTGDGQAPQGATTVVNPNPQSPIFPNSCVVTAEFSNSTGTTNQPLVITGTETQDIIVTVSLSTNKSFEWKDVNHNKIYEPLVNGEVPVDMGIRGMIPKVQ